ncbi:MAG: hypothetical protein RIB46_03350 [Pseudomonadales bacterium]
MAQRRLSRSCRVVRHHGEPALEVAVGCSGACGAACALIGGQRCIPLRWLGIDGDRPDSGSATLSVRAAGLTRAAVLCFGLPVLALLAGAVAGGAVATGIGLDRDVGAALCGLGAAWAALAWAASRASRRLADLDPRLLRPGSPS